MALPATRGGNSVRQWNTNEIREQLSKMGCNPVLRHAQICMNKMPCLDCETTPGRERYNLSGKQLGKPCKCITNGAPDVRCWRCDGGGLATMADRVCQSCHGKMREKLTVGAVQHSADELMRYTCQTLKQVDHTSSDGSQRSKIEVVFLSRDRDGKVRLPMPVQVIEAAVEEDEED